MQNLADKRCVPCESDNAIPIREEELSSFLDEVPSWNLSSDGSSITKTFDCDDFVGAVNFLEFVTDIAEAEGHHPNVRIEYGNVTLELTTNSIHALTENDFILAAKIDARVS